MILRLGARFEVGCDDRCPTCRNIRIDDICQQHHPPATTHFAQHLLQKNLFAYRTLAAFQFGDAALFVRIPIVALMPERNEADVFEAKRLRIAVPCKPL